MLTSSGVAEPEIIPEGENRIMVQLPGIKDPNVPKTRSGKTALLEFKIVDEDNFDVRAATSLLIHHRLRCP